MANNNAEDTLKELEDKLNQLKEQTDANKDELDNNCVKWDDLGLLLIFGSLTPSRGCFSAIQWSFGGGLLITE